MRDHTGKSQQFFESPLYGVQSGPPEEVYNHPLTDWVASFLGDTNLIPCSIVERNGDEAVVDLGGLGLARVRDRGADGENYAVSIRPEHLKFSTQAAGNGCAATLVSSTNLGATARHRLRAGGHELQLRELSSDRAAGFLPDEELWVGWDADKAQLLVLES
ncbi:TOBE domain-containing protein [Pseudarthrobacter sp. O4]|uniref:TOBE domain-containing protein n=1 Tax=Pseudarthrobacter sp. O4 TaxID=3418417 RepID=UPI003CF352AC